jgi:hypothetical protein
VYLLQKIKRIYTPLDGPEAGPSPYICGSDYAPSVQYAATAIARFANMSTDHFRQYLAGVRNQKGVHVLVKGKCDGDMEGRLLDRLEKRGREYEICIFVFFAEEVGS